MLCASLDWCTQVRSINSIGPSTVHQFTESGKIKEITNTIVFFICTLHFLPLRSTA